jgi:hypothetical protein
MNSNDENLRSQINDDDVQLIDRLVDGELDDNARRELLSSLDFTSDGWRRLALAFVEAQTWRDDLGELFHASSEPAPAPALAATERRVSPRWTIAIAMAASFAVAFGLALLFRGDASPALKNDSVVATPTTDTDEVEHDRINELREPKPSVPRVEELAADDEPIDLPVVFVGDNEGDPWERVSEPAMPPRVRRMLERLGHRVQCRRRLVPIDLPTGERVVVPVEQVEVELRGQGAYQ